MVKIGFGCFWGLAFIAWGCVPVGSNGTGGNGNTNANDNANGNANTNDNGNDNGSDVPVGVELMIPNEGAQHVATGTQVTYQSNPPASGPHWSEGGVAPIAPGFYEQAVEEEQWVHNLEHGDIVVLFDCGADCGTVLLKNLDDLFDAVGAVDGKLVISPYNGLPHLLTAAAWDVQLHLDEFDETVLLNFYNNHLDQGPE